MNFVISSAILPFMISLLANSRLRELRLVAKPLDDHSWWRYASSVNEHVRFHYCDVKMNTIASEITNLAIVYLTVNSGTYQRKHQSPASLAFVRGIHRRPVNSPHKGPVTRKMFPFDDVIMLYLDNSAISYSRTFKTQTHIFADQAPNQVERQF